MHGCFKPLVATLSSNNSKNDSFASENCRRGNLAILSLTNELVHFFPKLNIAGLAGGWPSGAGLGIEILQSARAAVIERITIITLIRIFCFFQREMFIPRWMIENDLHIDIGRIVSVVFVVHPLVDAVGRIFGL